MYTLLILNPVSGQGRAAREKQKLLELVSNMPHIHTAISSHPAEVVELAKDARAKGYDRIIVAGGDGTINQAVNGIGDSGIPLGIIPLGTGNVLAHHFRIPVNNTAGAIAIIQKDRITEVDVAEANGRRFLLMAGAGFDAAVVETVSPKVKDVLGKMAYAPAVIRQMLRYEPTRFRLTFAEGACWEVCAFAVIAANCGTYACNFKIAPEALIDDGLLDILVFESGKGSAFQFVGRALERVFQQQLTDADAVYFKSASVRIESDPPVRVQLDGDVYGSTPVDVRVFPSALKLIVP